MENLTGKQVGPYQVIEPAGEGGMAAVYKAYQPATDRYVALKILPRHFANDPQFITRFQQEAKLLAKLQHPHILPVFDFGEADGYAYIAMPFIGGGTLVNLMRGEPLPLAQIRRVISQVGDALDYAHQQGLIHRDVKPSNVLIDERENCSLMDFGLAKIVEGSINLTASGAVMGTPAYMSPEQGLGEKLDARTDVYSLGVILYEMAVGRVPYKAETPMAIIVKHINDPLPPPRTLNANLSESVERVILKSLAKKPEDRFETAGEMVKALQAAIPEDMSAAPMPKSDPDKTNISPAASAPEDTSAPLLFKRAIRKATIGFLITTILGLIMAAAIPALGAIIIAIGYGWSIGSAWRQLDADISRKQILVLIVIWTFTLLPSLSFNPLVFFIAGGLNGWLSGIVLQRAQPAMNRKQIAYIALGWASSWLIVYVIVAIATSLSQELIALLLIVGVITLGANIGSRVMFTQYKKAKSSK